MSILAHVAGYGRCYPQARLTAALPAVFRRSLLLAFSSLSAVQPSAAFATEGFFMHGYGTRQTALAGAGVANSTDAMALSLNPAGIIHAGHELQVGVSLFIPPRSFTGSGGPGLTPSGKVRSRKDIFLVPNLAYSRPLDNRSSFAIAAYGNRVNTDYPAVINPACAGGAGVYCGGRAGADLMQVFLSAGYARRIGTNLSLGIAPTLAVERFKADGLAAFAPFSLDPAHLSGKGNDWAAGVGIRVGAELAVMRQVRIGAAYQSKFKMSRLKKYSGLIEGNGRFDVPSTWTLGIAVDVAPTITAMFDYRRINYSDTGAISNSPTIPAPLGSPGGPGFGWKNVNVLEMGVEAKTGTRWTWRAGAAFNNDPLRSSAVTLNILSPAVPQQHYTAGASYIGGGNDGLDFALTYAPKRKLTGIEITPLGPNPAHRITVQMRQFEATVGWTRRF